MTMMFLLALTLTGGTSAQQPPPAPQPAIVDVDARWASWVGCWRLDDGLAGGGLRLCITPDDAATMRWQTVVGSQRGSLDHVRADGATHPVADDDCKGSERAEWSSTGRRLYRFTDVACGNESPRKLSTLSFLRPGPELVTVQAIEGGLSRNVRVQRYRRAGDQTLADGTPAPVAAPRQAAAAPAPTDDWAIEEVIEASQKLMGDAVQAALVDAKGPFDLNKKTLVAMSDGGVPPAVIDLMVAITYPKKFVIDRPGGGFGGGTTAITMGGFYDPFFTPYVPASYFFDCYAPMHYGYSGLYYPCGPYYSAFGYGSWVYYPYYGGGWVDVGPSPPPIVNPGPGPSQPPDARVVNGRGYTQVRPRDPEPPMSVAGTRGGNAASSSGGGSSSGSSGGSVSSGGYSSGGGGSSDSGRTAVPRPPGGID